MSSYTIKPTAVGALARGADYTVNDLGDSKQGYTDMLKRELGVSCNADLAHTRYTQLHELSHVQHSLWSPDRIVAVMAKRGVKLKSDYVLAAEDARVNTLLRQSVPDCDKGYKLNGEYRLDVPGYVSCYSGPARVPEYIKAKLCETGFNGPDLDRLWQTVDTIVKRGKLTVMDTTVPIAQAIAAFLDKPEGDKEPGKGDGKGEPGENGGKGKGKPEEGDKGDKGGKPEEGDGEPTEGKGEPAEGDGEAEGEGDEPKDSEGKGKAQRGSGGAGDDTAKDVDDDGETFGKPDEHRGCKNRASHSAEAIVTPTWANVRVNTPALTVRQVAKGNASMIGTDQGTRLRVRSLHRIHTDGVIFGRMRRKPGTLQRGTVLIDVSASISWDMEDLRAIVSRLPHATVAIYSGWRDRGELTIVAKDGARVARFPEFPGGNTCDGRALLWLSRQPGPRLWICDGQVSEAFERFTGSAPKECAAIMKAGGIVQLHPGYERVYAFREMRSGDGTSQTADKLCEGIKRIERGMFDDNLLPGGDGVPRKV